MFFIVAKKLVFTIKNGKGLLYPLPFALGLHAVPPLEPAVEVDIEEAVTELAANSGTTRSSCPSNVNGKENMSHPYLVSNYHYNHD